ncbi:MAG: Txe/YoeB family addiction module toxin [Puniceicoccales bacterium]|jgi:toxin YoeB|nr:Txe/YoeB family addiction module toxin [Puniceicoccales bacterium]
MQLVLDQKFRDDLQYWIEKERSNALRVMKLLDDISRHPFEGLGKPEPLKYLGGNVWSRRITQEHRLVYEVHADHIALLQCRYHY